MGKKTKTHGPDLSFRKATTHNKYNFERHRNKSTSYPFSHLDTLDTIPNAQPAFQHASNYSSPIHVNKYFFLLALVALPQVMAAAGNNNMMRQSTDLKQFEDVSNLSLQMAEYATNCSTQMTLSASDIGRLSVNTRTLGYPPSLEKDTTVKISNVHNAIISHNIVSPKLNQTTHVKAKHIDHATFHTSNNSPELRFFDKMNQTIKHNFQGIKIINQTHPHFLSLKQIV